MTEQERKLVMWYSILSLAFSMATFVVVGCYIVGQARG